MIFDMESLATRCNGPGASVGHVKRGWRTRKIRAHRTKTSFIVVNRVSESWQIPKGSCFIVDNRGKNKESFFWMICDPPSPKAAARSVFAALRRDKQAGDEGKAPEGCHVERGKPHSRTLRTEGTKKAEKDHEDG
jgi:hypothetical protein